jgi:hypothetical protein
VDLSIDPAGCNSILGMVSAEDTNAPASAQALPRNAGPAHKSGGGSGLMPDPPSVFLGTGGRLRSGSAAHLHVGHDRGERLPHPGQPGDSEHHRLIASVADVVRGILDVDPVTGIEHNLLPDRHLLGRTGRAVDSRPRQL